MTAIPRITLEGAARAPRTLYWRLVGFIMVEARRQCAGKSSDADKVVNTMLRRVTLDDDHRSIIRWRRVINDQGHYETVPMDLIEYGRRQEARRGVDPIAAIFGYVRGQVEYIAREQHDETRELTISGLPDREDLTNDFERVERDELVALLRERLDPDDLAALIEYHVVGGTQEEVASRLGTTRDRLQTRLKRGLDAATNLFTSS